MKKFIAKEKKGFTMVELIIVVSILAILLLVGLPKIKNFFDLNRKVDAVTSQKILVSAIDSWVSDNSDPGQRPSDINVINSQERRVYDYIGEKDFLDKLGHFENANENGIDYKKFVFDSDKAKFSKGVLKVFPNDSKLDLTYSVFPGSKTNNTYTIDNYDVLVEKNVILTSPVEYSKSKI